MVKKKTTFWGFVGKNVSMQVDIWAWNEKDGSSKWKLNKAMVRKKKEKNDIS